MATTDLGAIDWNGIEHAYGPATDVPDGLRALRSSKAPERRGALKRLDDTINHQGTITPAAVAAAPFLVELALDPSVKDRAALLVFLANLAVGGDHIRHITSGYDVRGRGFAELPEDHPYKAIYQRVAAGIDGYLGLLSDKDASVRVAAALLLAFLSSHAERSAPVVRGRVAAETDEKALASAVLCLGYLDGYLGDEGDVDRFLDLAQKGPELVRVAACLGLASAAPSRVGAAEQKVLLDALAGAAQPLADFPWCGGELGNHIAMALTRVGAARQDVDLLVGLLEATRGKPTQPRVASTIVDAVFAGEGGPPSDLRLPSELSEAQRGMLKHLVERQLVQRIGPALSRHGLLSAEGDLRRFLGLTPAGPLDREVGGEPLWRLAIRVMSDRAPVEAWVNALEGSLGPAEVIEACLDAAVPPYALLVPWPRRGDDTWTVTLGRRTRLQRMLSGALIAGVPADLLAQAADRLLEAQDRRDVVCAALVVALSEALAKEGKTLDARHDPLVAAGMAEPFAEDVRAVLARLPPDRREPLILALPFEHYMQTTPAGRRMFVRGAWLYVALCSSEAAADKLASAVQKWRVDGEVPKDRAVEAFAALGSAALPRVEALAADESTPHREVFVRARERLRGASA
ncbi:hypothetical protein [Sorangium sp. So ce1097]|uniref:hypothetical protein n=1 Tax=Sorangium sp. So ce1097 TaxID=3133330 RepID=UPI003F61D6B7